MIYKEFQDLKLSALGMGCMRLPIINGQEDVIDEPAVAEMVAYAFSQGINYFDTAWPYHRGNSETVMGNVLSQYPRESYYLATKFPGFAKENFENPAAIFEKQLEKCKTDYFDFYLLHNVTERNVENFMNEDFGVVDYMLKQKQAGRIRHLGFSTHGSLATMRRFLEKYGEHLEFCQIQLNWLDWNLQNAKAKVELLKEFYLPVWVMEPVRGGRLVNLPEGDLEKLNALRPGVTTPEWAFRFLQSVDGITMILSGMSNMQQLQENIATFCEEKPLNDHEWKVLMELSKDMIARNAVPCTGCSYCVDHCPMSIPIPDVIKLYNALAEGITEKPGIPGPADCIACGSCKPLCPQGIDIPKIMADYVRKLN